MFSIMLKKRLFQPLKPSSLEYYILRNVSHNSKCDTERNRDVGFGLDYLSF